MDDITAQVKQVTIKNQKLSTLLNITNELVTILDPFEIGQKAVNLIPEHTNFFGAILNIYDEISGEVTPIAITSTPYEQEIKNLLGKAYTEFKYNVRDEKYENLPSVQTILTGKTSVTDDFANSISPPIPKAAAITLKELLGIKAITSIPMYSKSRIIGSISYVITNKTVNQIDDEDFNLMKMFATQIGLAIDNAIQFNKTNETNENLKIKNRELDAIFEITNQVLSTLNPEEVASRGVNLISEEMNYAGSILVGIDENVKSCTVLAMSESITSVLSVETQNFTCTLNSRSEHLIRFNEDNFVVTDKAYEALDPIIPKELSKILQEKLNVKSIVNVPIKSREKVLGVIVFLLHEYPNSITESEYDLLQTFAAEIGIGLENARLLNTYQELTEQLKEKNLQLEAYSQKERDIMDILGHELRTPITIVRNYLSVLLNTLETNTEIDKKMLLDFVQKALKSSKKEMALLETMLAATKVEAKGIELNRIKIDPVEIITEVIENQKELTDQKGLDIIFNSPPDELPSIYADRTRIQQIFDNLISNAIKYTNNGKIEIVIENLVDKLKFKIIDTGEGIAKEDIPKLGTKFYRVAQHGHSDQSKEERLINIVRPGGAGLGLYVTFELIKLHDGEIEVESEINKGSTFSFTIPIYNGQIEEKQANQSKNLFDEYRKRKLKEKIENLK